MFFPVFKDPVDTPVQSRRSKSVATKRHLRRRAISDVGTRSHVIEAIEQTKNKEGRLHRGVSVTVTDTDGQTAEVSQGMGGCDVIQNFEIHVKFTKSELHVLLCTVLCRSFSRPNFKLVLCNTNFGLSKVVKLCLILQIAFLLPHKRYRTKQLPDQLIQRNNPQKVTMPLKLRNQPRQPKIINVVQVREVSLARRRVLTKGS